MKPQSQAIARAVVALLLLSATAIFLTNAFSSAEVAPPIEIEGIEHKSSIHTDASFESLEAAEKAEASARRVLSSNALSSGRAGFGAALNVLGLKGVPAPPREGQKLYLVDPWTHQDDTLYVDAANKDDSKQNEIYNAAMARMARFGTRVAAVRKFSVEAAKQFEDGSLDFVYVDGRHDRAGVDEDLAAWYPKLKKGGLFAGHDYVDGLVDAGEFGVRSAVDAFAQKLPRVCLSTCAPNCSECMKERSPGGVGWPSWGSRSFFGGAFGLQWPGGPRQGLAGHGQLQLRQLASSVSRLELAAKQSGPAVRDAVAAGPSDSAGPSEFVIATFYNLSCAFPDPQAEVAAQKAWLKGKELRGRIHFTTYGMNGQISGRRASVDEYAAWLRGDERFKDVSFVIYPTETFVFPKMSVKTKKSLVGTFDNKIDMSKRGHYMTPAEWRRTLADPDEEFVLVDVRNEYEWKIGHFVSAKENTVILPELDTFKEFEETEFLDELRGRLTSDKTKLLMCCTGGIRCEIYSAYLRQQGFDNVHQLKGGIINYGAQEGDAQWTGRLYVFDDRLTVPLAPSPHEPNAAAAAPLDSPTSFYEANPEARARAAPSAEKGVCLHCRTPSDDWTQCANVDCNCMYRCCAGCRARTASTCSRACLNAPRLSARLSRLPPELLARRDRVAPEPESEGGAPAPSSPLLEWRGGELAPHRPPAHADERVWVKPARSCALPEPGAAAPAP
eukprot:tig00001437_g8738.t1